MKPATSPVAPAAPDAAPRRFSPWRIVITVVLTVVLLLLLFTQVSLGKILATIHGADPLLFTLAAGAYLVSYFGRAIRWRVLTTSRKLSWSTTWGIGAVHNFMIRALPAKLGETSYIVLMRARGVPGTEAVAGLVVARVYDTAAAILFFVMSLFLARFGLNNPEASFTQSKVLNVAAAVVVLALCGLLVLRGSLFVRMMNNLAGFLSRTSWVPGFLKGRGIRRRLDQLELHMVRIQSARQAPLLFFATVLIWLPSFYMTWLLLKAFGTPLTFWGSVFASTLSIVATLLPVGTIGNFGTQEAGWTLGVMLLGGTKEQGIATGLSTHLVGFALAGLYGLIGAWISGVGLGRSGEKA